MNIRDMVTVSESESCIIVAMPGCGRFEGSWRDKHGVTHTDRNVAFLRTDSASAENTAEQLRKAFREIAVLIVSNGRTFERDANGQRAIIGSWTTVDSTDGLAGWTYDTLTGEIWSILP